MGPGSRGRGRGAEAAGRPWSGGGRALPGGPAARRRAPRRHLLSPLLVLLLVAGAESQASPSSDPLGVGSPAGPGLSLYMNEEEVRRLIGLDAELYYVRNDLINHYALSFNLLIPSETNSLHFSWHAKSKVEYKLGFQVDNAMAIDMPQANISVQGEVPRALSGYPTLRIEKNDLKSVTLLEAKAKVKDIAISRERITLKDVLQEGTFGRIFHGILIEEKDPSKEKQVFVKTVKDQASEVQVTMMLTESCKLRGLHHRNLLPITHVCIEDGEKPMVLLPFMNWGNLKLFLRQCKLVEANNPQAISQQDLVHMAIQIACGMSYLARREVIHKDLAARNCVIDDALQVKITDNALSRDLFPMDYHCLGDNENRPVRWMALESLVNNEFSSASDVWAFGVTLWELMTLGQTPYVDIDPFEMAAYLKDGYRIAQPINCPDELFAVMACCWALDPEERPKFQQLVQCLTEFHAALGAYV
ncbi:tyrosine-protein kinase RYK isoform X5 [Natator depressus]|uniref:tyrosine-protein kinase RYK isoform X5 n=1 Tax=Natator depressus TaxID=27790 RepID=UPI003EBF4C42